LTEITAVTILNRMSGAALQRDKSTKSHRMVAGLSILWECSSPGSGSRGPVARNRLRSRRDDPGHGIHQAAQGGRERAQTFDQGSQSVFHVKASDWFTIRTGEAAISCSASKKKRQQEKDNAETVESTEVSQRGAQAPMEERRAFARDWLKRWTSASRSASTMTRASCSVPE
jgi:hypothetical protein